MPKDFLRSIVNGTVSDISLGADLDQFASIKSFSGADINVVYLIPDTGFGNKKSMKISAELQTITISSATSTLPVRRLGESKPKTYTKGARTFAGSMIFAVINQDPFQELFALDVLNFSPSINDGKWHVDQMPPFDIIITATNEAGLGGVQVINGVTITNWGVAYSVDDMYTESTYSYIAEYVSPFVANPNYNEFLKIVSKLKPLIKTPDDVANNVFVDFLKVPTQGYAEINPNLPLNAKIIPNSTNLIEIFNSSKPPKSFGLYNTDPAFSATILEYWYNLINNQVNKITNTNING
jgi:hypothetical protein